MRPTRFSRIWRSRRPYAVIVLVAGELGPLPPTILSRCQLVPFRRLSERRRPGVDRGAGARARRGRGSRARPCVRRAARPRAPAAGRGCSRAARGRSSRRRGRCTSSATSTPPTAAAALLGAAAARGEEAREREQALVDTLDLTTRDADQRVQRAAAWRRAGRATRGARGPRGLVPRSRGRRGRSRRSGDSRRPLDELREDVAAGAAEGAIEAAEVVREVWRALEEFNLNPSLALEALFVRLRRALVSARPARV